MSASSDSLIGLVVSSDSIGAAETITQITPSEPPEVKNIPVWIWIAFGFLAGFTAGSLLIFQYSRSKIYSILATEKHKYLNDLKNESGQDLLVRKFLRYAGVVALLKKSKDEKKINNENYLKEIARLKRENEKLKAENEQKEKVITDQKNSSFTRAYSRDIFRAPQGKSYVIADNNTEIFFTIPEGDGSFKTMNAKNVQDVDCFYKIIPDKSGQKGRLYFISGEYDLRALDNIDYYINPVCEIQNISDRTLARRILMTDPGSVVKRGDIWKIEEDKKVKIKLV
jgi:cell division protein FtsB